MNDDTIDQSLEKLENVLSTYITNLGLDTKTNPEFKTVLNMDLDYIRKLTGEECAEYATLMSIFSLHIQNEINRHNSKLSWAQHNLNMVYGKYARTMGSKYDKFEERCLMLNVENSHAIKLNDIIKISQTMTQTLNFISRKIETIYQALTELSRSKRKYS